jgi:sporulation protein YlmC with PRC-barrel domain
MPHYGILREYRFEGEVDDLRGDEVYGVNDEELGKIDDVIFDHSTGEIRYVVLNTGGLFSSKKVMVPAGRIEPYGKHDDKFYAELDKERMEMLPEFDEEKLAAENDWSNYERDYEKRWNEGAVLYNKDTNRIVTPPTEEVEGTRQEDVEFHRGVPQREVMGPMGMEIEFPSPPASAPGPESMREPRVYRVDEPVERRPADQFTGENKGRRWSDFQDRLRSGRESIVVSCSRCGSKERVA